MTMSFSYAPLNNPLNASQTSPIYRPNTFNPSLSGTNSSSATTGGGSFYHTSQLIGVEHQQPSHHQQVVQQPPAGSNNSSWNSLSSDKRGPTSPLSYPQSGSNTLAPFNGYSQSNGQFSQNHIILAQNQSAPTLPPPQSISQGQSDLTVSNSMAARPSNNRPLANSKRAAQNRAAQRAFRQRKDRYIKDLEQKAKELDAYKKRVDALQKEKNEMAATINELKTEVARLKGTPDITDGSERHHSDDDSHGLGEEPWSRHKEQNRNDFNNRNTFQYSSNGGSPPPRSGLMDNGRSNGTPISNTESASEPYFRSEYRHSSANPPNSSPNRNGYNGQNGSGSNSHNSNNARVNVAEEDNNRFHDDLGEMLKTRVHHSLPHLAFWTQNSNTTPSNTVTTTNGSGTVVG